ncbi:MAG TPA: TonB-dependent receptor plug domain-containing protein [Polyangia bacterium]|nr:TonB-dependent receptor plug domain-containing protein [Polyangia bacterium]
MLGLSMLFVQLSARADGPPPNAPDPGPPAAIQMPEVLVQGRAEDLLGTALSASQGAIGEADLEDLPLLRRGELLEAVPGLVVTQHSGDGKANQYFLRGFNLDHGTDFAFSVDGVPVNLPSHAHGQGYSDLNFLIPELVDSIRFEKGPFYPEVGDFSGAGAAEIHLVDRLPEGILNVQGGMFGYARALAAAAPKVGPGTLLYAVEYDHYDGPWVLPERSSRYNGLLRYHWDDARDQVNLTGSLYWAPEWRSTDQIPQRAIADGAITRFGALDPTDGGRTGRAALSLDWTRHDEGVTTKLVVYAFYYRLNLFSNFTYFLADPVNGDQFEQIDRRYTTGADLRRTWNGVWGGKPVASSVGVQLRNDDVPTSGLDHTAARDVLQVVVDDHIEEFNTGVYANNQIQWTRWLKSELGARADVFAIAVGSDTAANTGRATSGIASPKATLVLGPWKKTEIYVDVGSGFHSNDARGVTTMVDPTTGAAQKRVPLLVRTKGAELGARTSIVPGLVSTLALWFLQSDSEQTFDGDAGDTEVNGPSRKYGVEWASFYRPTRWLTVSADVALTHARYLNAPQGDYIANSIPIVISTTATVEAPSGVFGGARLRYLSSQPLTEDDSVRQPSSTIVNAMVGYRRGRWEVSVEALNLLDSKADDIAYYYQSRLMGEPAAGVADLHVHPAEPFELRASLTAHY